MDSKIFKYGKYCVSLALAGILLYFCFRGIEWAQFASALRECSWSLIALSMCAGILAFVVRGLRWRMLLEPIDPQTRRMDTYDAVTIGNVSNFLFPFLGEFVRCAIISADSKTAPGDKKRLSYDKALGTIALERVLDLGSVAFFMLVLLIFKWSEFGAFFRDNILLPLQARFQSWVLWAALAAVIASAAGVLTAIVKLKDRIGLCAKLFSLVKGLLTGFSSIFRMKRSCAFIILTLMIWGMYWLQIILLSKAFPATLTCDFSATDALFIMLAGSLASFVPVPGGIGAYHYLVATALTALYGLPWATGIIFATLSHESQAVTMLLTGAASAIRQSILRNRE